MLDTVFGLPVHPLVVHATVVLVPLAALAVLLAAVWPRFRRWAGVLPLVLATVAVVLTPLSTQSGESLEERVGESDLVETHAQLGDGLLRWVALLWVGALLLFLVERQARRAAAAAAAGGSARTSRALAVVALVVALVGSLGTTVQVVRIGHTGAQAAWSDVATSTVAPAGESGADDDD